MLTDLSDRDAGPPAPRILTPILEVNSPLVVRICIGGSRFRPRRVSLSRPKTPSDLVREAGSGGQQVGFSCGRTASSGVRTSKKAQPGVLFPVGRSRSVRDGTVWGYTRGRLPTHSAFPVGYAYRRLADMQGQQASTALRPPYGKGGMGGDRCSGTCSLTRSGPRSFATVAVSAPWTGSPDPDLNRACVPSLRGGRGGPNVYRRQFGRSVRASPFQTTTTFGFNRLGSRQRPCCPSSGTRYECPSPPFGPLGWAIPVV